MSDPVFDENEIKRLVALPVRVANIEEIQQGAFQTMVDFYDRGVTREYYAGALMQTLILYGQCAKLWMLNSIHDCYHNGQLGEAAFDTTYNSLKNMVEGQQKVVVGLVEAMQECPTSKDRIS
jgi:hypothetical protein